MPRETNNWDTALNRENDRQSSSQQSQAEINERQQPIEGTMDAKNVNGLMIEGAEAEQAIDWMKYVKAAKMMAESYMDSNVRKRWENSYLAYRNQHFTDSKYASARYRGRSKFHRPKTRSFVKKSTAQAGNALFASSDVVQVNAGDEGDQQQMASAAINKQLLNYRLDRSSGKAAVPWFQIAMGAKQDAQITGLCISKQYWDHQEVNWGKKLAPQMDEMTGQPMLDPLGQPMLTEVDDIETKYDRPMCRLYPADHCLRDPAADWLNQAQESSFIILMNPMTVADAEAMMQANSRHPGHRWKTLDRASLMKGRRSNQSKSTGTAREGSASTRQDDARTINDFDIIWLYEVFMRVKGKEYHWWSVAEYELLSEPKPVRKSYPEFGGQRPITIGVAELEPHKIDPISPVMGVMPMQQEINDLANMTMEGLKQSVLPLTVLKRGAGLDAKQVQNRSADAVAWAKNPKEDIVFDRPPGPGAEAFQMSAVLNADFDDVAGLFNGASVQTNRQMNETVGGMKLLNASANVVGDFDQRVWIETWVEPTLRQFVQLEQYYESDKTIIALAGKKAKLFQRYGVDKITDELLEGQVTVFVNAGIGSADPMVKLDKFIKAGQATGMILGASVQQRAKQDPIIDEIFGAAGFRDAAERFFHPGDNKDPRIQQAMGVIQKLQGELASKKEEQANKISIERIKSATALALEYVRGLQQAQQTALGMAHEDIQGDKAKDHDMKKLDKTGQQKERQIAATAANKTEGGGKPAASPKAPFDDEMVEFIEGLLGGGPMQLPGGQVAPQEAAPDPMQSLAPMLMQMQQQNAQMMAAITEALAQNGAVMRQVAAAMEASAAAAMAPKKVIKDANGSPIGMVPMLDGGLEQPVDPAPPAISPDEGMAV